MSVQVEEDNVLTKISSFLPNEVNDVFSLIIAAKTENKFKTTRYNTLFYDGEEYVMCQMYTDDAFKTYDIGDLLQLKKFIVLLTTDLKVNLPLNNKGYTLDMTSISTIEKIEKKNIKLSDSIKPMESISNYNETVLKVFASLKCVVLNKTVSNPNEKTLVKYELINEKFDTGIHLILWTNDISLDNNTLYLFKYVTIVFHNLK